MSAAGRTPERQGRGARELRPVSVELGYNVNAEGSALVRWGNTQVLATVSIESQLPRHLRGTNSPTGWLTAEYALLPRSTNQRVQRERLYPGGRTQEIQRLVGRSLRSAVNLALFRGKTITVDTDVLVADGGTRCAAILAGYLALHDAANGLVFRGEVDEWPLLHEVAAVSVGVLGGDVRVDLDYQEDAAAEVDLNVVATGEGAIVEVQGGSEARPVPAEQYVTLIATGVTAAQKLLEIVRPQLG
ncbi:MAG: ribonuclease PH [Trueperaceae bacterium]